jgi:hypothetical protein
MKVEEITEKLQNNEKFFDSLVALIPTLYHNNNCRHYNEPLPFTHNPKNKKPKQEIKEMSKKGKLMRYGCKTELSEAEAKVKAEVMKDNAVMERSFINVEKLSHAELKLKLHNKLLQLRHNPSETIKKPKISKVSKKVKKPSHKAAVPILPIANQPDNVKEKVVEDDIQFSKIDFGIKKKTKSIDAQALLKKQMLKEEKLLLLPEEKLKSIQEKSMWNKLNQQAQGIVIKDDVKMLKKTVKRIENDKKKSSKVWQERKKTENSQIAMRQKKRTENIEKRKVFSI